MRNVAWVALAVPLVAACGGSVTERHTGAGAAAGAGGQSGGAGGYSGSAGSGGIDEAGGFPGSSGGGPPLGTGGACMHMLLDSQDVPEDALLLVDQSSAMSATLPAGGTSWTATSAGITDFVGVGWENAPGVGLQYFPKPGTGSDACTSDYAAPEIEIGPLPDDGKTLATSLAGRFVGGLAPTGPALAGAIAHMKTWGAAHPDRTPTVVLITGGMPTECDPMQIADLAALARSGFDSEPRVRTYVVAENLDSGSELSTVAEAGGGAFFVVNSASVQGDVTDALRLVFGLRGVVARCGVTVPVPPSGQTLDLSLIDISASYVLGQDVATSSLALLPNADACGEGWYFDGTSNPMMLRLCPETCRKAALWQFQVQFGCRNAIGRP